MTNIGMRTLYLLSSSDSGEMTPYEVPVRFEWINKPCIVRGEDFQYKATCLCSFPKSNGKVRYIVEDNGRLFVQRLEQITFDFHTERAIREGIPRDEAKLKNYQEAWGIPPIGG